MIKMDVNEVMHALELYYEDTRPKANPKEIKPFEWSGFPEEEMIEFILNSFPNVCRHIRDMYNKHELEAVKIIGETIFDLLSPYHLIKKEGN